MKLPNKITMNQFKNVLTIYENYFKFNKPDIQKKKIWKFWSKFLGQLFLVNYLKS